MKLTMTAAGLGKLRSTIFIMQKGDLLLEQVGNELYDIGEEIFDESQQLVPYRTGRLHDSAYETPPFRATPTRVVVEVGYNIFYALPVHENRRAGKTRYGASSGGWKYLSKPFNARKRLLPARINRAVNSAFVRARAL